MQIELAPEFDHPLNSFVIIAIEGDPESIRAVLQEILDNPNKPVQGIFIRPNDTTQVITPVWNGKKY